MPILQAIHFLMIFLFYFFFANARMILWEKQIENNVYIYNFVLLQKARNTQFLKKHVEKITVNYVNMYFSENF